MAELLKTAICEQGSVAVEMLVESDIDVVGADFRIEKWYEDSRRPLERHGIRVHAAATVSGMEGGLPVVL